MSFTTDVDLTDIAKRRDYKLRYQWGCGVCGDTRTKIFLFRTTDEYERGESNIRQKCREGHVTKPIRYCTKCSQTVSSEVTYCVYCEELVRVITRFEVTIEDCEKAKQRAKHWLKKRKIKQNQYDEIIKNNNRVIEEANDKLEKAKQKQNES